MRHTGNWASKPGSLDALHLGENFGVPPGKNEYGIPFVKREKGLDVAQVAASLVGYDQRTTVSVRKDAWLHFFLDDYRFEVVWNRPWQSLDLLRQFGGVLAPDFSNYVGWPWAANLWNVYRSRWCARFWQENGLKVIPVITWADEGTFEFCLKGVAKEGTVALAVPHIYHEADVRDEFYRGVSRTLAVTRPTDLLVYGKDKAGVIGGLCARAGTRLHLVTPARPHVRLAKKVATGE